MSCLQGFNDLALFRKIGSWADWEVLNDFHPLSNFGNKHRRRFVGNFPLPFVFVGARPWVFVGDRVGEFGGAMNEDHYSSVEQNIS